MHPQHSAMSPTLAEMYRFLHLFSQQFRDFLQPTKHGKQGSGPDSYGHFVVIPVWRDRLDDSAQKFSCAEGLSFLGLSCQ